ncbi:ATP synthase F1 subunit delta [Aurantibacillus circumpalustris]|uniref:ATP synthase F1 subunit delta n=1 Tax=Aurantibacillus circumpalustris TaxID=3036359 RepID=UPI00295C0C5F|nr:ATP synthase F1 subunit delta [Aurantibacillus circumpalustris]
MIVANRYAKSLMDLAVESKQLEVVRADMQSIEQVCKENREFELFLNSPVIKTDKKLVVMNEIFKGKISDLTLSFLNLITSKHRESLVGHIAAAFDDQYKTNKNIFTAVVTSAKGLDAATKQKVKDLVKSQMNGEVELIEKIDANTIGGFILRIGDKQLDKTVARQLSNLKKELLNKELN